MDHTDWVMLIVCLAAYCVTLAWCTYEYVRDVRRWGGGAPSAGSDPSPPGVRAAAAGQLEPHPRRPRAVPPAARGAREDAQAAARDRLRRRRFGAPVVGDAGTGVHDLDVQDAIAELDGRLHPARPPRHDGQVDAGSGLGDV